MRKEYVRKELEKIWTNAFHCSTHKRNYDELVNKIGKLYHDIATIKHVQLDLKKSILNEFNNSPAKLNPYEIDKLIDKIVVLIEEKKFHE